MGSVRRRRSFASDAFPRSAPSGTFFRCRWLTRCSTRSLRRCSSAPWTSSPGLAWVERAGEFFGGGDREPPDLIIQDELHLLAGPLGTTVGVYESAFETLCALQGRIPKVIASTATIREAARQAVGIFGRRVRIFPPTGLSASDSFYSRVDEESPGRLFVGVMAPSHTPSTSIVRTAAVLLQGPLELALEAEELDAYWTLVAYHNSLGSSERPSHSHATTSRRGLGSSHQRTSVSGNSMTIDLLELTSNVPICADPRDPGSSLRPRGRGAIRLLPRVHEHALRRRRRPPARTHARERATEDHIRVHPGDEQDRARRRRAGLVVTHFSASKPRDRSHYESFVPYHQALYRWVEPSSVTPFSLPSRVRALHAALVIVVRHGAGLSQNSAAVQFRRTDPRVEQAIDMLIARVAAADPSEANATRDHVRALAIEWEEMALASEREQHALHYHTNGAHLSLLRNFGDGRGGWQTLHSMRSIDRQCDLEIAGAQP